MPGLLLSVLLLAASPAPSAAPPAPSAAPSVAPSAAPSATPSDPSFPTIGRTRSKRYCQLETDRTNGAILVTLTNDKIIAAGIARLRAANLDRPESTLIEREKTMHDLRAIAADIQMNMRAGEAQIADLRALAVKEPDAARSPELKLLADRIEDALDEQRGIGSDLAKMLTIVDGRFAAANGEHVAAGVVPEDRSEHVRNGLESIDQLAARDPLNNVMRDVADDFSDRTLEIGKSEDAAAVHAPKAISGC